MFTIIGERMMDVNVPGEASLLRTGLLICCRHFADRSVRATGASTFRPYQPGTPHIRALWGLAHIPDMTITQLVLVPLASK
jgi:hypothetical protein